MPEAKPSYPEKLKAWVGRNKEALATGLAVLAVSEGANLTNILPDKVDPFRGAVEAIGGDDALFDDAVVDFFPDGDLGFGFNNPMGLPEGNPILFNEALEEGLGDVLDEDKDVRALETYIDKYINNLEDVDEAQQDLAQFATVNDEAGLENALASNPDMLASMFDSKGMREILGQMNFVDSLNMAEIKALVGKLDDREILDENKFMNDDEGNALGITELQTRMNERYFTFDS